ncbi:hypothetical protein VSDG_03526 [Cytospora chrysosperma]|uniref:VOC domain-containing protein n=1 Tax=Cytospora chrysosperma TaxID=252740 RepID=A0A423WA23_CYTCH|nr:hypothetical protein VSDG_03526 [Valsa sordida]
MKMVSNRDQAKFDRAQWQLKVIVPCWMTQISLFIIIVGVSSYLLANAMKDNEEERGTAIAWECITIGVAVISIFCTAYEIFKTVAEALTPRDVMISSLIKITGTILSMIMTGVMSGTTMWKWSIGSQVAHGLSIICILIMASYGALKWRVLAQYDDYHHPANVKPFGFKSDLKNKTLHSRNLSDEDWDVERQADWVVGDEPLGNTVNISSSAPMAASPEPAPTGTRARGSSFLKMGGRLDFSISRDVKTVNENGSHSRSNSASALMNMDTSYESQTQIPTTTATTNIEPTSPPPAAAASASSPPPTGRQRSASYISVTGTGVDRRASYNHTRDTSFDDLGSAIGPRLLSQQQSHNSNLKNDVDDALGAEFGWGSASRTVRNSLGRAPSDGSETGVVLGSVPERREDDDGNDEFEAAGAGGEDRRRREVEEASRALLGGGMQDEEGEGLGTSVVPAVLRPAAAGGRPRGVSETIEFVVTPPPRTSTESRRDLDVKCARATHDFLRDVFPVPASEGRIFLLPPPGGQDSQDQGGDAVFVLPYLAVLVDNVRQVRDRLGRRGVRCREVVAGEEDGLEWVEFSDPDGYRWRVARLVWGGV